LKPITCFIVRYRLFCFLLSLGSEW
jgi:hypothetical protein